MSDNIMSFAEQVGKDIAKMQPLIEPELRTLDHTMTGTGASTPNAWVPFSPGPSGWVTYNTVPTGEYIFMLSTDSPGADFTFTFRSGGSSSSVVLTRTGNRNNPVTVRVRNPGVASYSVQHHSPGATLTMRVIKVEHDPPYSPPDTGVRDLNSLVPQDLGWNVLIDGAGVFAQRVENVVFLTISSVTNTSGETGYVTLANLPTGMRPNKNQYGNTWRGVRTCLRTSGRLDFSGPMSSSDYWSFSYVTKDPWPTSLPGTPA